jgi:hypothetical protein
MNIYEVLREKNKDRLAKLNLPDMDLPDLKVLDWEVLNPIDIDGLVEFQDVCLSSSAKESAHGSYVAQVIQTVYDSNIQFYSCTKGSSSHFTEVIDYCMANDIRLVNASISIIEEDSTEVNLKRFAEWGGIVVASAGNVSGDNIHYPARSPYTICVSATNFEDCDGSEINVTEESYWYIRHANGQYDTFNGTSCPTPVITGCVGIMLAVHPEWCLEDIVEFLKANSVAGDEDYEMVFAFPDGFESEVVEVTIEMDTTAKIEDGRTMVPVRYIAEALGGTATWDETTQTVTLVVGEKTITMVIGENILIVS